MGKIIDFLLTDNWEEFQRVQLYKNIGNSVKNMSKDELVELQKMLNKANKLK